MVPRVLRNRQAQPDEFSLQLAFAGVWIFAVAMQIVTLTFWASDSERSWVYFGILVGACACARSVRSALQARRYGWIGWRTDPRPRR